MVIQPQNGGRFIGGRRLPPEYQEIEWIKAIDGYIQTDIISDMEGCEYNVDCMIDANPTTQGYLIAQGTSANNPRMNIRINTSHTVVFFTNGTDGAAVNLQSRAAILSKRLIIRYSVGSTKKISVDGAEISGEYSPNIISNDTKTTLFANGGTTERLKDSTRIYRINYADSESDYILLPCYRKLDDTPGIYNIATDIFCPGNGAFTLGPDKYN